ncbi:hypothetical protein EII17_07955 [Clostridiales bacterium COT073_COT-073]|nr:hypothetical protein EII17_07955 [Clostridiales bacterium COT073_COT-073]
MKKAILLLSVLFICLISIGPVSASPTAIPSTNKVAVNGKLVNVRAYVIENANYFKLRDIAMAVNGTAKQFDVSWDGESRTISLIPDSPYTVVGGELNPDLPEINSIMQSQDHLTMFSIPHHLSAYTINGNNYYKLRDLCALMSIGVTFDAAANQVNIDTTTSYYQTLYLEMSQTKPLETLNNNRYQYQNDEFGYSFEVPVLLSTLPKNSNGMVLYSDSEKGEAYTQLSVSARKNIDNQSLEEIAKEYISSATHPSEDIQYLPVTVAGADKALKATVIFTGADLQILLAAKNDIIYQVYYFSEHENAINPVFPPVLSLIKKEVEESLTIK